MIMPMVRLKEVAEFVNGKAFQPSDWSEAGVPIIRIQNLNGPDKPFNYWAGPLEKEVHVQQNDLLLAWSGTPGTSFGAHIWGGGAAVLNQHIFRVDLNEKMVTKEWAKFVINSQLSTLIGLAHGGVGLKHVTKGMVEGLEIPVPPLSEQRRIAAILDKTDALRVKRREALAQLDSLTQSIFIEMFGDPAEGLPKSDVHPLESLLEESFQNGAYFPKETYCSAGGVEMVHMSDAFGGIVPRGKLKRVSCDSSDVQKYSLSTDDILIARRSLTYEGAAKPCMIPRSTEPLIFESSFIRIKPDKTRITPLYLFHYLNNERVRQKHVRPYVTQSTISGINQSNLAQVPVMQPALSHQQEFGVRIGSVEQLKRSHSVSLAELDTLFASLQHRAFRGEL